MKKLSVIFILGIALISPLFSQIEVRSTGNMYTNQKAIYFRDNTGYLAGIGYHTYGTTSTALTLFSDLYRYVQIVPTYTNDFKLANFYFGSTLASCYTDFYGKITFNRESYTGGLTIESKDFVGYNLPTLYPRVDWGGVLGHADYHFAAGYIDNLFYEDLTDISDSRVKENVLELKSTIDNLKLLKPVSYDYKISLYDSIPEGLRGIAVAKGKNHFGFIAQDVQQIYPNLVKEIPGTDLLGIDYISFVPVLVKGFQELDNRMEELANIIADQELELLALKKIFGSNSDSSSLKKSTQSSVGILFQNSPNPFYLETTIKAYIPESAKTSQIFIHNLEGKQLMVKEIVGTGDISIKISGTELSKGIYIYSLVMDGVQIDSKRMIITD